MDYYFVLNGLHDGERGVMALTTGVGRQQRDGWYYLPEGYDDGIGPYVSREDAQDAARLHK